MNNTNIDAMRPFAPRMCEVADIELRRRCEKAFDEFGVDAFPESRATAAAHEVGHVIARFVTGTPEDVPIRVRVDAQLVGHTVEQGCTWTGRTAYATTPTSLIRAREHFAQDPVLSFSRVIVGFLAGHTGEMLYGQVKPTPVSSLDELILAEMLCVGLAQKLSSNFADVYRALAAITAAILQENISSGSELTALLQRESEARADTINRICASVRRIDVGQEIRARLSLSD